LKRGWGSFLKICWSSGQSASGACPHASERQPDVSASGRRAAPVYALFVYGQPRTSRSSASQGVRVRAPPALAHMPVRGSPTFPQAVVGLPLCLCSFCLWSAAHLAKLRFARCAGQSASGACPHAREGQPDNSASGCRAAPPWHVLTINKKSFPKEAHQCACERIRTLDTLVRSQVLYPAELRTHPLRNSSATMIIIANPGDLSTGFFH
jgi:hypothetical protein